MRQRNESRGPGAAASEHPVPPATASGNPYDQTPYPDLSYVHTHPDRLATLATLLGLKPPPVAGCRLLEIGCAAGGNLLPMAYSIPDGAFVGIDYSARQIEEGHRRIGELGLRNVWLVCQDLMALDPNQTRALGDFDDIIAHGVYSWAPAPVRDRLLALCKQLLRPNGIVYISYNTYPGWHVTGIVRDAMLFHAAGIEEPRARAAAAREMIQFLADSVAQDAGAYSSIFQNYLKVLNDGLKGSDDSFLLHDELEETNDPVYFTQFVDHAARHGLQYLVEAELREVLPSLFKPEVQAKLQQFAGDAIALEQYMDFLRNRMFRQTLLCHADVPVQRVLRPEPVFGCLARTNAQPAPPDAPNKPPGLAQFRNRAGATLTTDHAVSAAAMTLLGKVWPQALPFAELLEQARAAAGPSPTLPPGTDPPLPDDRMLAGNLLRAFGYSSQLVGLHTYAPAFTVEVGERPLASSVARQEAMGRNVVTNVWHERVTLQPFQCHLLIRLNGERTRSDLLAELRPIAKQLNVQSGDSSPLDEAELERQLQTLARAALLVG